jgi:DNA-binding CsgD family transcriptional regulator
MDGEAERARALAREELDLARRWGTPQVIGIAQRGLALITGDEALLREAVASLARSPARLELARTQVELGALLRRRRRRADARPPLREGLDLAHACGAVALAERARDELVATGARPRRPALSGPGSLTVSERRVAELAIRGLTNRRIAQELFVTPATVETHLRHAFQKLDIAGRGELGAALAGPPT